MNFPYIRDINGVYDHIVGYEDAIQIKLNEWNGVQYYSVFYIYNKPGLFDNPVRRECRGMIFDADGYIRRRPFHKFFNLSEVRETSYKRVMDRILRGEEHWITEKLDGSMIAPFTLNGDIVLGTKAGVTEISESIPWSCISSESALWIRSNVFQSRTPIFEFVSPDNRIVIEYDKPRLVYLAMRDNHTGEYIEPDEPYPGPVVHPYQGQHSFDTYVKKVSGEQGREGDVLTFRDGMRVKIKCAWYVNLHNVLKDIALPYKVARLAWGGNVDDIYPMLPEDMRSAVEGQCNDFLMAVSAEHERLKGVLDRFSEWWITSSGDRKSVAVDFVPTLDRPEDAKYVFACLDYKDIPAMWFDEIDKKVLSSQTQYEAFMERANRDVLQ